MRPAPARSDPKKGRVRGTPEAQRGWGSEDSPLPQTRHEGGGKARRHTGPARQAHAKGVRGQEGKPLHHHHTTRATSQDTPSPTGRGGGGTMAHRPILPARSEGGTKGTPTGPHKDQPIFLGLTQWARIIGPFQRQIIPTNPFYQRRTISKVPLS